MNWSEVNKLGCIESLEGGGIGHVAPGFHSVKEVAVLTGSKPQGGKKNNRGGHLREDFLWNYFQQLLSPIILIRREVFFEPGKNNLKLAYSAFGQSVKVNHTISRPVFDTLRSS